MMSKKVPELRFKGFTDDWEKRKLKDIAQFNPKTVLPDEFEYVDLESVVGTEMISHRTVSKEQAPSRAQRLAQKGDVFYQTVRPYQMNNYLYDLPYDNYVFSTGYAQMRPNIDSYFLLNSVQNKQFVQHVLERSTGTSYPAINSSDLSNIKIYVPVHKEEEQQKIGAFFKHLDDTIALHQRKLDLLKEQKKGFLQKMFPKNGAKVPELRFAGFADDWEERKLSSGLREYTDRVIVEDDKEYYQISVRNNFGGITLRGSKIGNKIGRKRQAKINLTKYPQTLIFTRQTVEQGGIGWVDKYCDGAIVTENMPTISLDTSVFSKYFLTNLFQTRIFYKNAILDNIEGGSAQIAIHESKFLSSILLFPNLDEQEKIGQFFKQLDNTIALHQRKIDLLKEQKKGFLQKMFV
ncbi:restriction endonuclease subunit S [Streptococcus thermophilus]|uniref:restriction endonuclease subunit S n=4 Tax=Streptococcus thermophilus TaxID=1308 RepID=UPI0022B92CCE|nr:restriction endonuclease subunit S [Streptococcus thermophilus]WBF42392.1 restriction endonuclease subunit S [Streptococcus thermophilus]